MLKQNGIFSILCELMKRQKSTEEFCCEYIENKEAGRYSVVL